MMKLLKNLQRRLKGTRGFSLLENIMATTILATGLIGGMMVMQNAVLNTQNSDLTTLATQLANEKIEIVLADNSFSGYDEIETDNYAEEQLSETYNMTRSVTVTEVDSDDLSTPTEGSGMKKVDVTVSWGNGAADSVTVSTLVSDTSGS